MSYDLRKWSHVYLNLGIFTVFLKNRNFISKIQRSKATDHQIDVYIYQCDVSTCDSNDLFSFYNQFKRLDLGHAAFRE